MSIKYYPMITDIPWYLTDPWRAVLDSIIARNDLNDGGITFDELREQVRIGPRHLRRVLADLFNRDWIMGLRR